MRKSLPILWAALLLVSAPVLAQPPAGHPAPKLNMADLKPIKRLTPEEMPLSGKVLKVEQVSEYSYMEVATAQGRLWLAAPRTEVAPGQHIRFEEGDTMKNFPSQLLRRSFESIMFIGQLAVMKDQQAPQKKPAVVKKTQ
ncbi:hypothetical protein [Denitratisoma oestradiolicum]|uniref:Uncharacterized protein n=1 Tax=Denitratisoma oestradiolicum TaxID=311182 RepID=A0A6S6YKJ6_9PROT|nr:hypothetical protein [Denitratisoma oestradiolicum]TWO79259.1 hypothetical protein CBW56_15835 [Denitratisoma oestradiolicum]CAB1368264.1 conserved exported protein of unknown function [Denitratisoma oestradiolicum]